MKLHHFTLKTGAFPTLMGAEVMLDDVRLRGVRAIEIHCSVNEHHLVRVDLLVDTIDVDTHIAAITESHP